ncbi:MAG: iron ABC transporter permease [Bacteroidia bacterium]|nr:iron ABC transporter permease [Bacteroidia bacterium]
MRLPSWLQALGALVITLLVIFLGMNTGPFDFMPGDIFRVIVGQEIDHETVLLNMRLPRVILALITGAILTLGGFFMQALVKNPLADPYIMGISTGAGFGVNLLIVGLIPVASLTLFTYPLFAFLGGMVSLILVLALGYSAIQEDSGRFLVAGIAVSSLFTALTGLLIYEFTSDDNIRQILFWSFGSLNRASWEAVSVTLVFLFTGWGFGLAWGNRLDVLILGDQQARTLGMNVTVAKLAILGVTVFMVAGSIAFTGPIGFVGMMLPHFSRAFNGVNHRRNLVSGPLLGGCYLALCDVIGRAVHPVGNLPIGIVTAILGVPFFLYLLYSGKGKL